MPIRKFLVPSSVARLIRREAASHWRVEGYLNGGTTRRTHVVIEEDQGHLMLEEEVDGKLVVEDTPVPRRHAEALLSACLGRLDIERSLMALGGRPATLDRIEGGGKKLDVLSVLIDEEKRSFSPPAWVGREVSEDSFEYRKLAVEGIPEEGETAISNAALERLLDFLEGGLARNMEQEAVGARIFELRQSLPGAVQSEEPGSAKPTTTLDTILGSAPRS